MTPLLLFFILFFFNDTATTEIYTLSLHDALPIFAPRSITRFGASVKKNRERFRDALLITAPRAETRSDQPSAEAKRSEEHTSELQSPCNLVCRLLLEKKKNTTQYPYMMHVIKEQT